MYSANDCTYKCNRIENVYQHEINKSYIVHLVITSLQTWRYPTPIFNNKCTKLQWK